MVIARIGLLGGALDVTPLLRNLLKTYFPFVGIGINSGSFAS
jgi:hypothetical protein